MIVGAHHAGGVDHPLELGVPRCAPEDLRGGEPDDNARTIREIFAGADGGRRDRVFLATKAYNRMSDDPNDFGSHRYHLVKACEDSLRRLGTDHIDLYQMHRPHPSTPIDETLRALDDLVRQGKVRYLGSSNLSGWQVVDADWTARTGGYEPFVSAQNEYSWLDRSAEAELVPALAAHAGRIIWNGWPTGVAVSWGMQHGGGWPATTASVHTSVGPTALRRFVAPVSYQNLPEALLPEVLRSDNPHGMWRRLDGELQR